MLSPDICCRFIGLWGVLLVAVTSVTGGCRTVFPSKCIPGTDPEITRVADAIGSKEQAASVLQDIIRGNCLVYQDGLRVTNHGYSDIIEFIPDRPRPQSPGAVATVDTVSIRTRYMKLRTREVGFPSVERRGDSIIEITKHRILGEDEHPVEFRFSDVRSVFYSHVKVGDTKYAVFSESMAPTREYFWIGLSREPMSETYFEEHGGFPSRVLKGSWPFDFEFWLYPWTEYQISLANRDLATSPTANIDLAIMPTRDTKSPVDLDEDGRNVLAALTLLCPNLRGAVD